MPGTSAPFSIQFQSIEVLNHRIEPLLPTEVKPSVGFSINLTHRFDGENKRVQVELDIQILKVENQQSAGALKTCCTFAVTDLAFNEEEQTLELEEQLMDTVNSISLSTTRGIIFSYFAQTHLNPLVLPIIDPKDFRPSPDIPEPVEN